MGTVIAVALAIAAVLAGIGFAVFKAYSTFHVDWKLLDGTAIVTPVKFFAQGSVIDQKRLTDAVNTAVGALVHSTKWGTRVFDALVPPVKIYIWSTPTVDDQRDAGLEQDGVIHVGVTLAALCHELGHVCEERLEGDADLNHVHFLSDGIYDAVDAYMKAMEL